MRPSQRLRKGIAIVVVLTVMMLLLTLSLGYLFVGRRQVSISKNRRDSLKAFYLAEAGVEDAIDQLITDDTWRTGFSDKSLAGGTYTVTLEDTETMGEVTGEVTITSTGNFEGAERTVVAVTIPISPFSYAQQSSTATGSGDADFTGSSGTITGDILIGGDFEQGSMSLTGTVTDGVGEVSGYSVDFDSYEEIADYVIEGDYTFSGGAPHNGIYYIKGTATIEDNATINGSIIAENNVVTAESGVRTIITPGGSRPAIIAGNNIEMTGMSGATVTGVVYADNNITVDDSSNCLFRGGLLFGNSLEANDCSNLRIVYFLNPVNPPPYFIYSEGEVQVVSWQGHP